MTSRNLMWMWLTVAALAVATFFVGMIAGHRADDASVIANGRAELNVAEWSAALWALVAVTAAVGVVALVLSFRRSLSTDLKRMVLPAVLIGAGMAAAPLFLPLLVVSVVGAAWLIVRLVGAPEKAPVAA